MKTGAGLLAQLERCGLSAKLADEHAEASDDSSGFRLAKIEIARAFSANDQATIAEANSALRWLVAEPGKIVSVGEPVDLIDQATGEVLVTGRPGAVLTEPAMVVGWRNADAFNDAEPEDDLGLVAMGLATCNGQPFRVAHVALRGIEVFPRRSSEFTPEKHAPLFERIRAAVGRPRIACPGDWCGACRQAPYCEAWLARAKTALAVFCQDAKLEVIESVDGEKLEIPQLEITNENSGPLAMRLKIIAKAAELAQDQLKSFVRRGGRCVVDGKEYCLGQSDGRETANVADLKAAGLTQYIKKGQPYETARWRKVRP